jgi:ESX secretion-associated protein EspG
VATRGFELSVLELDLISEALRLDVRQFPFQFPYHGELIEDRQRLANVAQRTLEGKGLTAGNRFVPDLEELVAVYARAPLALSMFGAAGDTELYARVASDHRSAVLVQQREQTLSFTPISPEGLVRPLVSLLPPLKPGPGRSVTISKAAAAAPRCHADDEDGYSGGVLQRVRPPQDSSAASNTYVDEIMQRKRLGSCAFTVSGRDRNGQSRAPLSMSTIDTESGRYALIPGEREDGTFDVSVTPADLPRIDQALTRFVEMLG